MDTTEERKSSEGADRRISDLSRLFQKYKIEYFFWRSYKDRRRFNSFLAIIVTMVLSISLTIAVLKFIHP